MQGCVYEGVRAFARVCQWTCACARERSPLHSALELAPAASVVVLLLGHATHAWANSGVKSVAT